MPDSTLPPERRWGPDLPVPPGRRRRVMLLAVLLSGVVLAGVTLGVLFWLSPPKVPAALPVWVTTEPGAAGPVPWAQQDRDALVEGSLLGRPLDDGANPSRDQLRLRFRSLANASRSQPLVVSLTVPASVDATGGVYLLPVDPLGDTPRNRLPLAELLAHLRDSPARHKLLVLQLTPPPQDPLFAPPGGLLSDAVFRALDETPDPNRLCLVACGPGQVPLASPDLGRSVFGYYLEVGLRGTADGWGPAGDRDGRVSVTELAAFVRGRVSRWAAENLRSAQTPVLVGTAADFTLHTYPLSGGPAAPAAAPGSVPAYPDWLKAGWERHDRWLADGTAGQALRAVQLVRAALLTAERDLLAGRAAADVQRDLDRQLAKTDQVAAALTAVPTPDPLPTLAAVFPGYVPTDPTLQDALDRAATQVDAKPPTPPQPAPAAKPGEAPGGPALPAEFEPLVKGKQHRDLALAAFRLLAADPNPSAVRVRRIAQMLATQEPVPKFAESALIRQLADLADPASVVPWSPGRAALALQTAQMIEEVAARRETVAWAKPALDDAYRLRADAEAVLFAPGYASPDEAQRRLRAAADAARELKAASDQLRAALTARDEAVLWLDGGTPVLEAGLVPLADATRLAAAAQQLADSLTAPDKPIGAADFAALARTWREREAAVRTALATASAPVRGAPLTRFRGRVEAGEASPALLAELDALLLTPLVPAPDRVALWTARGALTRRLNDEAVRKDAVDDESVRAKLAKPDPIDPRDPAPPAAADKDHAVRRAAWTTALLRVGGLPGAALTAVESELAKLAGNPPAFAAALRRVWLEDVPARLTASSGSEAARLARVVPVVPAVAFLDQADRNPEASIRRDRAGRLWAWQAARFGYEAHDRAEGVDRAFAALAARACEAVAGPANVSYLELAPVSEPVLTPDQEAIELRVNLRRVGGTAPQPVAAQLLTPDEDWVRTTGASRLSLGPVREQGVTFGVEAGARAFAHPTLRGVLVEAEADGRTFHRRVPVNLDAIVNRLDLLIRADPASAPYPAREIALRPHGHAQPTQLLLANPSPKPRTVVARLAGFDRVTTPVTVAPGKLALLVFPAPAVAAPAAPPPPPAGKPAAPTEPAFSPLTGPLVVELLDPADPERVVQRFTVPVRVLDPAQYLRADEATFRPATGPRPNRLSVRVGPDSPPPGPPIQVKVHLPPARNPEVVQVRDANLSGPLPADNRPLTLYAEGIAFAGPAGANLVVTVEADGVERAFTFAGPAPVVGGTVRLPAVTRPMVRVARPKGGWYAAPATPLAVPLEVDNAPDGSRVELRLGTEKIDPVTGETVFETDAALTVAPARERDRGVRFDPKGETLLLRGTLKDPAPRLPVGLLVGERTLEAQLLDATGTVLDTSRATVMFDGTPPTNVHFLDLPPRAAKGQPLTVRATCDPTVSGIKEVFFFVGKAGEKGDLPATPAPVPGKLIDPKGNVWQAVIQPGIADRVSIGVKFVTMSNLDKVEPADIELVDAAELTKPKPGKIVGTLIEARVPQGDHPVFLYDEKRVPIAQAKTKKDGTFAFADVPPGKYYLYAIHTETNRDVLADVTVVAGETTKKELEMLLRSTPP